MRALIAVIDERIKAWLKQDNSLLPLLFNGKQEWIFEEELGAIANLDKPESAQENHLQPLRLALEKAFQTLSVPELPETITTALVYPATLSYSTLSLIKEQFSAFFQINQELEWDRLAAQASLNQSKTAQKDFIIITDWQVEDLVLALFSNQQGRAVLMERKIIPLYGFSPAVLGIAQYIISLYRQNRGDVSLNKQNPEFRTLLRNVQKIYAKFQNEEQTLVREKIFFPHDAEPFTFNLEKNDIYRNSIIKDTIGAILQDQIEALVSILENANLTLKEMSGLVIMGSQSKSEFFEKHLREYEPSITIQYFEHQELLQLALDWQFPITPTPTAASPKVEQTLKPSAPASKTPVCKKIKQLATKNMEVSARVSLYWQPNRGVHLKVISKGEFFAHLEVLEIIGTSANMKVKDILRISLELQVGRYLETDLIRNNQNLGVYRSGTPLTAIEIWEEQKEAS
jgi:hypothetical protein